MRFPDFARLLLGWFVALCTLASVGAQSIALPAVDLEQREAVRQFHNTYYPQSVGLVLGFTGDAATYKAGTISSSFRTAALLRANYYRRLAGLEVVTESKTFDDRAHAAAFLMWTGGDYLYYPPRWSSPAWTAEAYEGAWRSAKMPLLATGWGSGTDIDAFMQEAGAENQAALRRHQLLFPPTRSMGYGATPGTSALHVREDNNDTTQSLRAEDLDRAQAWPSRGFLPAVVPFPRWSWAWMSPSAPDFSSATVSVQRDNQPVAVTIVERSSRLVWDFAEGEFGPDRFPPARDTAYAVSIRGVKIDGLSRGFDYTVIVFDPAQPVTTPAPVVVVDPISATINEYAALQLKADASDGTFQWFKDGMMIPSATQSSLFLTAARASDTGEYWVEVRNPAGLVRSDAVPVLVIPAGLTPPQIVTQPLSSTFTLGKPGSFSVTASSPVPMTYQWRKNGIALPGRTLSRIEFPSVSTDDEADYDVVVSNYAGSTTSAKAHLGVFVLGSPPSITQQPTAITAEAGQRVTFSVGVNSQITPTYQWRKNGITLLGATASSYGIASAQASHAGYYDVIVTNPYGTVTSKTAQLKVTTPNLPEIAVQPTPLTIFAGSKAQFYVVAAGPGTLTYQWYKNEVAIPGATAAVLTIATARSTDSGNYHVVVGNSYGSVASAAVSLRAMPPSVPVVIIQPLDSKAPEGTPVSLVVAAEGRPTLSYQWRRNGSPVSGATTATYAIASVDSSTAGNYDVVVANAYGSVTSRSAAVTVAAVGFAPTIDSQPSDSRVAYGSPVTLQVSASGTAPLSYQWFKGSVAIAGATQSTYEIAAATTADAGSYSVTVTNEIGNTSSRPASLSVDDQVFAPSVAVQPADLYVHRGDRVSFTVQASGTNLSYQWYLNDTLVPDMTGPTFQAFNAEPYHDTWRFHCVVSNSLGSVTSRTAVLSVWTDDSFLKWATHPVDVVTNLGGSAAFTAKAVAYRGAEVSYRWYLGDTPLAGAGGTTLEFTGVQGYHFTDYHVVASATIDGVVRSLRSDNVWVTASRTAPVVTSEPSDTFAPSGSLVGFRVQATGHPLTYQWYLNDQPVPGFTSSYFPSFSLSETHVGWTFHCVVGNELGSVTTRKARVSIAATPPALYWGAQPADVVSTRGGTATLSCNAIAPSGATIAYEWYMGSTLLTGLTKSYLTINGLADYHFTDYHVVAVATVAGVPYSITSDPVYIRSKPTP